VRVAVKPVDGALHGLPAVAVAGKHPSRQQRTKVPAVTIGGHGVQDAIVARDIAEMQINRCVRHDKYSTVVAALLVPWQAS
jgi:hypothetical protein